MHYYQFNIGDYLSHTRHLTLIQDLAYRRLLDLYYLHERPVSGTLKEIARRTLLSGHEDDIEAVLLEFFPKDEAGDYRNYRADAEIAGYKAMSEGGKRGASKRWGKDSGVNSEAINNLMPTPSPSYKGGNGEATQTPMLNNKHETINNKQEPILENGPKTDLAVIQTPVVAIAPKSKGSRLPVDWKIPKTLGDWAITQGLTHAEVLQEGEKFKDYWIALTGPKATKNDWPATWRNWIRNRKAVPAHKINPAHETTEQFLDKHFNGNWYKDIVKNDLSA